MQSKQASDQERPAPARRPNDVARAVRPVAEKIAAARDLSVWDVRFLRDAGRETLRVACDRVGGVTADELGAMADDLSRTLDRLDAVPGDRRYVLEVTSPGAERTLEGAEQFRICVHRTAKVSLTDGRTVVGTIEATTDRAVELGTGDDESVRVMFDDIAKAELVVNL